MLKDKQTKKQIDLKEYTSAKAATDTFRTRWDDFLRLAYAKLSNGQGWKSQISTGDLSNLIIERSARVAAKIPTGKIIPLEKSGERKATIINMAWNQYILPKANWGYSMPVKLRMWDYYSLIYGIMPMFHGYHIDENYTGPDCRLVDLRFVFPQAGRLSPNDADFVFYETFHSKEDIENMKGKEGWNNAAIEELLNEKAEPNLEDQTTSLQDERGESNNLYSGMYKLITKYVRGSESRWTTFDEKGNVIREVQNPFKSGRIPFVFKIAFPLVDSFWGLGDVERGESLQKAINAITNLSIDYLKTLIFPPVMMSKNLNQQMYPMKPAAVWKFDKSNQEFVETAKLNEAPAGIVSQLNQGFKGALLNQNGTTDTTIAASDGLPGFGKTPDALKKLDQRESSRDNFDRQMYEAACKELFEGMLEELGTRNELPIIFDIFEKDIAELEANKEHGADILGENYDAQYAKIEVQPEDLHASYKFNIDIGSSAENDDKEEFERIQSVKDMVESPFGQKAIEQFEANGETFDYKELFQQYLAAANIKNQEKMIVKVSENIAHELDPSDYSENFNSDMITNPDLQNLTTKGAYNG